MNTFVEDQAYFSDGSAGILHDAHVVGASRGYTDIDFEYFAATEDDEAEHLQELEFAIDEEAFYHYFETDAAIDIEVPGVQFYCTGNIGEIIDRTE